MPRVIFCFLILSVWVRAQAPPPESTPPPSRPIQLPLSGRAGQIAAGTVVPVQNPLPSGLQSVNTITSTVQVQGTYQGSVPSERAPVLPISLSLDEALRLGLEYNLGGVSFQNSVRQAEALRVITRASLLPTVTTGLIVTEEQVNLAALGFTGAAFGGLPINVPTVVGPFHFFDLRAGVSQSVFDLTRRRNYRGSKEILRSEQFAGQDAHDLIALAVTGGYLQVIAAAARVETTRAQVATAQATYRQAVDRRIAGVAPRIDETRTQVELQVQQQRFNAVENDLAKLKIALGRLIGLAPGQEFSLTDTLPYGPLTGITLNDALARAFENRADLKAAESQVRAAELVRGAAVAERYPSVQFGGDYGVIGPSPGNSHGTFAVTGGVRVPIFQGGRVRGDIELAESALDQRRAEYQDLRGRIDADVRNAILDLNTAANQVAVAQSNRGLAQDTLTQARDRFAAGVADTLEVVQAQESVASAEQDYISSLYSHNLAKASLARAIGQAEQNIRQFLRP
jgi:outer membrane protein TolC